MDDDEFNDFQQAVEAPQETPPENSYKEDELNEHQTNLAQNKFTPIDPLLINPSYSLAAEPIQSPNADIEIKDLEGSSQPRLNKIQSENLSSPQDVFFNFDKNYARSEPTIELIDYTNFKYLQENNLFNEILADKVEDSAFQNLENTNLDQNIKIQKEQQRYGISSKEQHNLDLQKIDISENTYHQSKVEDLVKESLPYTPYYYYQQLNQKKQVNLNTNKDQTENKEIQSHKEQQQITIQQTSQQKQQLKYQSQEEDQFGDFQQTLPNTEETAEVETQNVQNQDYHSEILQPQQAPSIVKKRTRKQQLQQFVKALPDYSFLFLQAFQSF